MRRRWRPIRYRSAGALQLQLWSRCLAIASLFHLALGDYDQSGWLGPRLLGAAAALGLLSSPHWRWSLLFAFTKLWTLLALRDVLSQSAYLFFAHLLCAYGHLSGTEKRRGDRGAATVRAAARLTALLYGAAALHKLNVDFITAPESCARHGWEISFGLWGIDIAAPSADLLGPLVVLWELSLALLCWRGSLLLFPLGAAFHLPLTLTIAPAFGAVMFSGYAASLSLSSWAQLRRIWRAWTRPLIVGAVLITTLSTLAHGALFDLQRILQHLAFVGLALLALLALYERKGGERSAKRARARPLQRWIPTALLLAYALHNLSPYFGLQFQHTGAMLSNLRIDAPCANHLFLPAPEDPYLRIDDARFADGLRPERVEALKAQLWGWAALTTMRQNWCVPWLRPIRFSGHWWGEPWTIDDLCSPGALEALRPPPHWPPDGWQRFQKNLSRECQSTCVH